LGTRRANWIAAAPADRALISRSTLHKIERLEQLVDKRWDWVGLAQDDDRSPAGSA
jgi:hypothetical protein